MTDPLTVYLGPEVCVVAFALLYRLVGDKESIRKKAFWRFSGKLVSGGIGMVIGGLLLVSARADVVRQTGPRQAQEFVRDFQDVGWVVGMGFLLAYFIVMMTARAVRGKKALLLDPILPDAAAIFFLVGASWIWMMVVSQM